MALCGTQHERYEGPQLGEAYKYGMPILDSDGRGRHVRLLLHIPFSPLAGVASVHTKLLGDPLLNKVA